jgi:hypothetical protein
MQRITRVEQTLGLQGRRRVEMRTVDLPPASSGGCQVQTKAIVDLKPSAKPRFPRPQDRPGARLSKPIRRTQPRTGASASKAAGRYPSLQAAALRLVEPKSISESIRNPKALDAREGDEVSYGQLPTNARFDARDAHVVLPFQAERALPNLVPEHAIIARPDNVDTASDAFMPRNFPA